MIKNIIRFISEYDLFKQQLNTDKIIRIFRDQGFSVEVFDSEDINSPDNLLSTLSLSEYAESHYCFTYYNKQLNIKIVFINSSISFRDRLFPLLHEEAHIFNEHFTTEEGLIHTTSIRQENQANIFAFTVQLINKAAKYFKNIIFISVLMLFLFTFSILIYSNLPSSQHTNLNYVSDIPEETYIGTDSGGTVEEQITVYWSLGGEVYHLYDNCRYFKNVLHVESGTITESKKSRCCLICERRNFFENKYKEKD